MEDKELQTLKYASRVKRRKYTRMDFTRTHTTENMLEELKIDRVFDEISKYKHNYFKMSTESKETVTNYEP
jgi:hypothetical protein